MNKSAELLIPGYTALRTLADKYTKELGREGYYATMGLYRHAGEIAHEISVLTGDDFWRHESTECFDLNNKISRL